MVETLTITQELEGELEPHRREAYDRAEGFINLPAWTFIDSWNFASNFGKALSFEEVIDTQDEFGGKLGTGSKTVEFSVKTPRNGQKEASYELILGTGKEPHKKIVRYTLGDEKATLTVLKEDDEGIREEEEQIDSNQVKTQFVKAWKTWEELRRSNALSRFRNMVQHGDDK